MNLRLKTDIETENKLNDLQKWLHFSSKAAVMRLAICYSLRDKLDPRMSNGVIEKYDIRKQDGADYLRGTVLGSHDDLFQLLIVNYMGYTVTDEEFFPEIICAHIKRGVYDLHSEYRFLNNRDKLLEKLMQL